MKPYPVVWWEFAQSRLAQLWLDAADQAAVTRAANEIDRRLADDPKACAESDHEDLFRVTVDPLTVQFTIEETNHLVAIWTVRLIDR